MIDEFWNVNDKKFYSDLKNIKIYFYTFDNKLNIYKIIKPDEVVYDLVYLVYNRCYNFKTAFKIPIKGLTDYKLFWNV